MHIQRKALLFIVIMVFILPFIMISSAFGMYSYLNENWDKAVALASAVGTVVAAIATWLAARRAADGAEIAKKSMEASELAAKKTLSETQLFNRRTSFENRYALLLAQHDQYHKQLCDYIDREYKLYNKLPGDINKLYVIEFFKNTSTAKDLKAALAFLTGHEIISRYMRTLYHLLRFVYGDFYLTPECNYLNEMKKYTSPVRSVIRNDVLIMIALNATNVISERAKDSGYSKYQEMLHFFNFFEHTVFTHPSNPNEIFSSDDWINIIHLQIRKTQSNYDNKIDAQSCSSMFSLPEISLFSPLILCLLTYENPVKKATEDALHSFFKTLIEKKLKDTLEEAIVFYEKASTRLKNYESYFYQHHNNDEWKSVTKDMLNKIYDEVKNVHTRTYSSCFFKPLSESGENLPSEEGKDIYSNFATFVRYEKLHSDIINHGGLSNHLDFLQQNYEQLLSTLYENVSQYNVRPK